jgi:hypothetical protein
VAVAAADMLGRVALAARLTWWLGGAALQGVVVMTMRRGHSMRAQLLMRNVCNESHGRFNKNCSSLRRKLHT